MDNSFEFIISPKPRQVHIDVTEGNYVDVAFAVQNTSGRPVLAEAIINPLSGPSGLEGEPLPPEAWTHWLEIVEEPEWFFEPTGVRTYTVRVRLPENLRLGTYRFQLLIVGVEDPDEEFAASDEVTFTAVGPKVNIRNFVIGALALLALIILLAVGAAIYLQPKPQVAVRVDVPTDSTVGEPYTYTIHIENSRSIPVTDILLDYTWPPELIGATAFVPDAPYRRCDEEAQAIRCGIGTIEPNSAITVTVLAIPGPNAGHYTATRTITHTSAITVNSGPRDDRTTARVEFERETTILKPAEGALSIALDPTVGIATVDEPVTYNILAWNNITSTKQLTLTYELPQGMRYAGIPRNCSQQETDYFTLICHSDPLNNSANRVDIATIPIKVVPLTLKDEFVHLATIDSGAEQSVTARQKTEVVNSALLFDGIDDYANLGLQTALKTFTVEMWVHPFINQDGQSFIGVHQAANATENSFLVGYWEDALNITIGEEFHSVVGPKLTERYHLAVAVENLGSTESAVFVYVNGLLAEWEEPDPDCTRCKIFKAALDGEESKPWVLAQDWDRTARDLRTSDFFRGAMSDVRVWDHVRKQGQIEASIQARPHGDEAGLVGYWRLTPLHRDPVMALADRTSNDRSGKRFGANWGAAPLRFGSALNFDGVDDVVPLSGLQISNLEFNSAGEVELTMAGWLYVDSIPTEEQWILGHAGPSIEATTLGVSDLSTPPLSQNVETTQTDVDDAKTKLINALERQQALDFDIDQARANQQKGRDGVLLSLGSYFDREQAEELAGFAAYQAVVQLLEEENFDGRITPTQLAALRSVTETQVIPNQAVVMTQRFETIRKLRAELATIQPTPPSAPAGEILETQPSSPTDEIRQLKLEQLLVQERIEIARNLITLAIAAQEDGLQSVVANNSSFTSPSAVDTFVDESDTWLDQFKKAEAFLPFRTVVALAKLERGEEELVLSLTDDDVDAVLSAQSIQEAQTSIRATLPALGNWLQVELDGAVESDDANSETIARLATQQRALSNLARAEEDIQTIREVETEIAAARNVLNDFQARADQLRQAAEESTRALAKRQGLIDAVAAAERSRLNAPPQLATAAQQDVENARSALSEALLQQFVDLQESVATLQLREETLQDIAPRLDVAVAKAVDVSVATAQKQKVESWIGPFLDLILGTRTPQRRLSDVVYAEALIAAQQALKSEVDANVDVARKELNEALDAQNRISNVRGNAELRQKIIDNINNYIDSLSKDVREAKQKLDEALKEQRGRETEPDIPLALADALAQAIARATTDQVARQFTSMSIQQLLSSVVATEEQIVQRVEANLDNALENVRRPVRLRLYYDTYYAAQQLTLELDAGLDSDSVRLSKTAVRDSLVNANLALLRILDAEQVLLRPGVGFERLIQQVADESNRAASIETLHKELQDALANTDRSLRAYVSIQRTIAATSGLGLPGLGRADLRLPGLPAESGSTVENSNGAASGSSAQSGSGGTGSSAAGQAGSGGATAGAGATGQAGTNGATTGAGATGQAGTNGATTGAGTTGQAGTNGATTGAGATGQAGTDGSAGVAGSSESDASGSTLLAGLGESEGSARNADSATASEADSAIDAAAAISEVLRVAPNLWAGIVVDDDGHVAAVAKMPNATVWSAWKDEKPIVTNQWVHYAAVIKLSAADTMAITLYRNGDEVKGLLSNDGTIDVSFAGAGCPAGLYLGGLCNRSERFYFDGQLDEVRLWNRALDEDEIDGWRDLPGEVFNEYAYWPFDDGPGRSSAEHCDLNLTCDRSGDFHFKVAGPSWTNGNAGRLAHIGGR